MTIGWLVRTSSNSADMLRGVRLDGMEGDKRGGVGDHLLDLHGLAFRPLSGSLSLPLGKLARPASWRIYSCLILRYHW
jgi:hypothetical protein